MVCPPCNVTACSGMCTRHCDAVSYYTTYVPRFSHYAIAVCVCVSLFKSFLLLHYHCMCMSLYPYIYIYILIHSSILYIYI